MFCLGLIPINPKEINKLYAVYLRVWIKIQRELGYRYQVRYLFRPRIRELNGLFFNLNLCIGYTSLNRDAPSFFFFEEKHVLLLFIIDLDKLSRTVEWKLEEFAWPLNHVLNANYYHFKGIKVFNKYYIIKSIKVK